MGDFTDRIRVPTQLGLKIEDEGDEVERLQDYLKRFGYIRPEVETQYELKINLAKAAEQPEPKVFDEKTQQALKTFQEFNKLPITGVLDKATINLMLKPRCGMPDLVIPAGAVNDYVYTGKKWSKLALKYMFQNFTPDLSQAVVKNAIKNAFSQWDSNSQLSISEVAAGADVEISWETGDHGDGYPFDGPSGVLAHAFFPEDGRVHFDEDELWTDDDPPSGIDLETVALHEFGHTLGLAHSNDTNAVMYAYYGGRRRDLRQDDINGIQYIYGGPTTPPPGPGPCPIATAVSLSTLPTMHEYLQFLRVYRNEVVLKSAFKDSFEKLLAHYYRFTPSINRKMETSPTFRKIVECAVYPFIFSTKLAASLALASRRHHNHALHRL